MQDFFVKKLKLLTRNLKHGTINKKSTQKDEVGKNGRA